MIRQSTINQQIQNAAFFSQQFQVMSFPKLSDFMGRSLQQVEYKRISVMHCINNSLTRNTISELLSFNKSTVLMSPSHAPNNGSKQICLKGTEVEFNYEQKLSSSLLFTPEDLHKLLDHLFNKKTHDVNDRNFIRRLLLKYFPQNLIYPANRDFITFLQYLRIPKHQTLYIPNLSQTDPSYQPQKFYLLLKGKVKFITDQNIQEKVTGQYFGELQIIGGQWINEIRAKTDVLLFTLDKQHFQNYFQQHFELKYSAILKRVSIIEPLLNLVPVYNKLKILDILEEREFKTGQKILQKGEVIEQITFVDNCAISSSEDRILSEYKATGLSELVSMQHPVSKESVYCMENTYLLVVKVDQFRAYLPRQALRQFLIRDSDFETKKKDPKDGNQKQTMATENSYKIQNFIRIKKVKFLGQRSRVLTEPHSNFTNSKTPKAMKKEPKYPQYTASFIFLKNQSCHNGKSPQQRHAEIKKGDNSKHREIKEYFKKARQSLQKKRWLDEMQLSEHSMICNPQKNLFNQKKTLRNVGLLG